MHDYEPPPTRRRHDDIDGSLYEIASRYNLDAQDSVIPSPDNDPEPERWTSSTQPIQLVFMTDADLGGLAETRQSTTGIMVYADGVPVYWKSKTEKTVFWSTAASEYVGFSKGNAVAKWLNSLLEFYGNPRQAYFGYCDNQAAETLATNPAFTEASRSVDIRYHAIRQDYADGHIKVGGICTSKNTADILAKPLHPHPHLYHARALFPTWHSYYNDEYLTPQQLMLN